MLCAEEHSYAQTAAPREQDTAAGGQSSRGSGRPFSCFSQFLLQLMQVIGKSLPFIYMENILSGVPMPSRELTSHFSWAGQGGRAPKSSSGRDKPGDCHEHGDKGGHCGASPRCCKGDSRSAD